MMISYQVYVGQFCKTAERTFSHVQNAWVVLCRTFHLGHICIVCIVPAFCFCFLPAQELICLPYVSVFIYLR